MTNPARPLPAPARWEDFIDLFTAPSAVIARRQNQSWLAPLLIVVTLLACLVFTNHTALEPVYDAQLAQRAEGTAQLMPGVSAEDLASAQAIARSLSVGLDVASVPVAIVLFAGVVWLAGRLAGVALRADQALIIGAYASVLDVALQLVRAIQGLALGADRFGSFAALSIGPARLLDSHTHPALLAISQQLDVFIVWKVVVAALGICAVSGSARLKPAWIALLLWIGVALPALAGSVT